MKRHKGIIARAVFISLLLTSLIIAAVLSSQAQSRNQPTTTMTENKRTVEKYMAGFRASDHAMILDCLTDDITWEVPGQFYIKGKEAFDKEIENPNFTGKPDIQIIRYVEENDFVVAEGTVKSKFKNGDLLDAVFCDMFHMQGGKIKHLTSYLMMKQNAH